MSRLIVKNLPKKFSEAQLRKVYAKYGTITAIQLKYTTTNKFRQIAFVGFQEDKECEHAIRDTNNTFIQTSRIKVELCHSLGASEKPRPWSKYAPENRKPAAFAQKRQLEVTTDTVDVPTKRKKDESLDILKELKDEPLLEEFLEVHDPKSAKKLRAIRDEEVYVDELNGRINNVQPSPDDEICNRGSLEQTNLKVGKQPKNIKLYNIKIQHLSYRSKKKQVKQFLKPLKPFSIRVSRKTHGLAYAGFKTEEERKQALLKDRSIFDGQQIYVSSYKDGGDVSDRDHDANTTNPKPSEWCKQEKSLEDVESIAESGKIFVRGFASVATSEEELTEKFGKFGPLAEVKLPVDSYTKQVKGFAIITFVLPEHAVKAYSALDGTIFHGRMLHLLPGKDMESKPSNPSNNNYKAKKLAQLKADALSQTHTWNSLFLGTNAVAEVLADKYNTTKSNILLGDDAAVRLTLGETQLVLETKKYLEREGVVLDAFADTDQKRSNRIILAKNLPHRTSVADIETTFSKYGAIARIILPPSGITAVVEFVHTSEAKTAFEELNYTRFFTVPLFLEWAPENSLKSPSPEAVSDTSNSSQPTNGDSVCKHANDLDDNVKSEPDATLFVKNLNFKTDDAALRAHFEHCGKIVYANVALRKDPERLYQRMSMGYGFVKFVYKASADKALKTLQYSTLDGKALELKRSERATRNNEHQDGTRHKANKSLQMGNTKIIIRNIPFEANESEIHQLFKGFGTLRALRVPRKPSMDAANQSQIRGFAFVDFTNANDAKMAFDALGQSSHLLGRRLVFEWAKQDEDTVQELQEKTARHYQISVSNKTKNKTQNKGTLDMD